MKIDGNFLCFSVMCGETVIINMATVYNHEKQTLLNLNTSPETLILFLFENCANNIVFLLLWGDQWCGGIIFVWLGKQPSTLLTIVGVRERETYKSLQCL